MPQTEHPFDPLFSARYGFAMLDRTGQPALHLRDLAGWVSLGGQPAKRFTSLAELSDCVLWCNLPRREIWALGAWQTLKPEDGLGLPLESVISQWIHPLPAPEILTALLSEIFCRVLYLTASWFGDTSLSSQFLVREESPVKALAQVLHPGATTGSKRNPVSDSLRHAYYPWVRQIPPLRTSGDHARLTLLLPPGSHALTLLRRPTPPPVEEWKPLGEVDWPTIKAERVPWLALAKNPVLVRLGDKQALLSENPEPELRLGIRAAVFRRNGVEGLWTTAQEAAALAPLTGLLPEAGFMASKWGSLPQPPPLRLPLPPTLSGHLPSTAIALCLLRTAWATPPSLAPQGSFSAIPVWESMYSKEACLEALSRLREGYPDLTVVGYGVGRVEIEVSTLRASAIQREAVAAGFSPPRALGSDLLKQWLQPPGKDEADFSRYMHALLNSQSDPLLWLNLDRLAAPWGGSGVKESMQFAAKSLSALSANLPTGIDGWWHQTILDAARHSVHRLKMGALSGES